MNPRMRDDPDSARFCPECRRQIHPGKAEAHAEDHWPKETPPNRMSKGAQERRDIVRAGGVPKGDLP